MKTDKMDLEQHTLEEMFLYAMKSEVESRNIYDRMAKREQNPFLKDKLKFLSSEELKHWGVLKDMFKAYFPQKNIILPDNTPVPLPEINWEKFEDLPVIELLEKAMNLERATLDYYVNMADRLSEDVKANTVLMYFAAMERGHYELLKIEKENAKSLGDYDTSLLKSPNPPDELGE